MKIRVKDIVAVVGLFVMLCVPSCRAKPKEEPGLPTVAPTVAGTFYSADPQELSGQVERFFMNVSGKTLKQNPIAVWVPHAGLVYSGQIAAVAYYEVKGRKYDTIVLVGPAHRTPVRVASIYPKGAFQTPLGNLSIDEGLAKKIADLLPEAKFDPQAYVQENSLEVQFPFLVKTFPKTKVVTVLVGPMDLALDKRVGKAIAKACEGRKVLLVASSDMSHYPTGSDAAKVDETTLNIVRMFDGDLLPGYTQFLTNMGIKNLDCLLCGDGALVTVMEAARLLGANDCKILAYTNSAEVSGNERHAVGYGAAAFYKNPAGSVWDKEGPDAFFNDPDGRKQLLRLARDAIEGYAGGSKTLNVSLKYPELFRPQQVFVTLKKNGQLRGCVGNPNIALPLYEAIIRMAAGAGYKDQRFAPLTAEEAKSVKIEISVLQHFRKVARPDEIKMGTHGVIVRQGNREGIFLPEVAEVLPDKEKFLDRLCEEKAGLPAKAWKDPKTELWTFTTLHFSEE